MKIYDKLEQGTPEWKRLRAGKITASCAKDARAKLKSGAMAQAAIAYAARVAVERMSGEPMMGPTFENWEMREGKTQEPFARGAYERHMACVVDEVGAIATEDDAFLYSPDGLVGADGLLEVKCLFSASRIMDILAGGDISDFEDQCNFGLWLTGRKWIDLLLWVPQLAESGLGKRIFRINRDEAKIDALEQDLLAFKKVADANYRKLVATRIELQAASAT